MKRIGIFFTILMFSTLHIYSQDTVNEKWSLEACIRYALENNLQVKQYEISSRMSEQDYTLSKTMLLPNLNAGIEHNLSSGRSLDQEIYEWVNQDLSQGNLGLQSDVTVFNGLQGYNAMKMQKYDLLKSQAELDKMKNDITLLVTTDYLQLLLNIELLDIAKEQLEVTRKQVERMERLVDVGNEAKGALLEVKAQHSNQNYNVTMAQNQVKISILELAQVLDLETPIGFDIVIPDLSGYDVISGLDDVDTIYNNAMQLMPEIEAAMMTVRSSERNLAIEKGKRMPELYLRGLYYSRYIDNAINPLQPDEDYTWPQQVVDNQYKQLSIGINIPIFNRWSTETSIKKAKLGLADAEIQLEQARIDLLKKIQQYYMDAINARDKYESAEEALINNQEAFRYTEQRFSVGLATALELDNARNNLFQARSSLAQAQYQYIFYLKILDFYQGKKIIL